MSVFPDTISPSQTELTHPENRPHLSNEDVRLRGAKILIVDDEPINIKVVRKHLQGAGYRNFVTTTDPTTAMEILRAEQPDVVLLDVMMPQVNGLQILEWIRADERFQHVPVLILTASTDSATKLSALELGATDFLAKPVDPHELLPRLRNVLIVKAHQDYLAGYSVKLEREVQKRTAEVEMSRLRVIQCLARAGEYRDDTTGRHVIRVGRCAALLAEKLGYSREKSAMVELAAQLHDIGKIGIPDAILLKPGKLTPEEYALMRKHCEYGKAIIDPTTDSEAELSRKYADLGLMPQQSFDSPLLKMAATIAMTHHERFDGSGYPIGISGAAIPLEGRITAIVDVFDALHSARPYKAAYPLEKCIEILQAGRGTEFDPTIHEALLSRIAEINTVYIDYPD
jgi:putative two-component system response regulator